MEMNNIKIYNADTEITSDNINYLSELNSEYTRITNTIRNNIDCIFSNFLEISALLHEFKYKRLYEFVGYKDIYDYAYNEFDLSKTSVKNYIQIAEKCLVKRNGNEELREGRLLERYKDYNYSQLVELLNVDELDLEKYTPTMSIRKIRENKYKDKLVKYFTGIVDLENENSTINNFIKLLKDELKKKFPNEQIFYKTSKSFREHSLNIKFYLDSNLYDILFEFEIFINWDFKIRFAYWGVGYVETHDYDFIVKTVIDKFDDLVKKKLNRRKDKESDYKNTKESNNSQTSDLKNEIFIGSFDEFRTKSYFNSQNPGDLVSIISMFFGEC